EYFLREGKVCREIAFIEKGLLRHYYLFEGREYNDCFCKENSLSTSYRSLITQAPTDFAVQALENTRLIILSYDSLQKLYEKHLFWQEVGRMVSEQEYLITEAYQRMLRNMSATDRYLHILKQEPELLQRVPLSHLASYLQIVPETLSRIRNKIART
ncbi:MAG: Crp/Fnr family transcriptional regulator, partial [Bacteroidota bacterium]